MKLIMIIFVLMAIAVIICMQVLSVEMVKQDAREEGRIEGHRYGMREANRRYEEMILGTEFRVHQTVTFTNESDIKW